ncbi:MAG: MFS transporter [Opitutae bacterium]|nr:MFS transporter [Opitutae bacterium]
MSAPATTARPVINERALLLMLAVVHFTHIMDFVIMMPLGARLMRVFSISPAQFGHLVAAYGFAAALSGFLGGFVLDRFERKHALLTLYAGFSLATLACALSPSYHWLLLARFAAGAFGGVAGSVVTAMVGDVVPPERRGRAMGTVMSAFPLATVLGIPFGLWLADLYEWHAPFFLLTGMSVVVFIAGLRLLPHVPSHLSTASPWTQMRAILVHPIHQRCFMLSTMLVFAGGCVIPFMAPSMVANVGLSEAQLKYIYLFGGAATLVSTYVIGRCSDRFDKLHVLSWVSLLAMITVAILTNLPAVPLATALTMTTLFFVSMSGRFAPAMAMMTNAVEARYRGGFMSVNSALQQASGSIANLAAGLFLSSDAAGHIRGYGRVGLMSLVCFFLTGVLAWRLRAVAPHAARPGASQPAPVAS